MLVPRDSVLTSVTLTVPSRKVSDFPNSNALPNVLQTSVKFSIPLTLTAIVKMVESLSLM